MTHYFDSAGDEVISILLKNSAHTSFRVVQKMSSIIEIKPYKSHENTHERILLRPIYEQICLQRCDMRLLINIAIVVLRKLACDIDGFFSSLSF